MKNRNSRMREIAFHTLFCMVSMVSILLTMQKKYTSENDPLQAQITMREFQFFESIIEKNYFLNRARENTFFNALVSADKGYTPLINISDNIISDIVKPNIPDTIANNKTRSLLHGRYFKRTGTTRS
jgi:hypothetical protein